MCREVDHSSAAAAGSASICRSRAMGELLRMNLTELSRVYALRAGAAAVAVLVFSAQAQAQVANETGQNVNLLNLLSPFLSLNATSTGQATLQTNLNQAVAINNAATPSQQSLAISDKNLLNGAANTVVGLSGT